MTVFIKVAKQMMRKLRVPQRQISAVLIMLAMLMPVTAPISVSANSLDITSLIDDGSRLAASGTSFTTSAMTNFSDKLFKWDDYKKTDKDKMS